MERIELEQHVDAAPAAVWPFLVHPPSMNRWSRAAITTLELGDAGDPGGVGALRRIEVRALGRRFRFDEAIVRAEPAERLVYRVFRGLPMRAHEGEITLAPWRSGTRVRWTVEFDSYVPGFASAALRLIEAQLRESLAAMARVARGAPSGELASPTRLPKFDRAALEARASAVLAEQRALADRLATAGDAKYWFARVYQYVTERQLARLASSAIAHVDWVLLLVPEFHRYYEANLARWIDGDRARVEAPWRAALRTMDEGGARDDAFTTVKGMMLGVRAHIEEDLPRALADVWFSHWRGFVDYARFRADYVGMADVFREAADRLLAEMPRAFVPRSVRLARAALPPELPDALLHARYYDVPRRRLLAFERGGRIAALLDRLAPERPTGSGPKGE